ncbi:purine and uridine phosphorylase [Polychaeton citri CBS 116435]|uniref:Purine and uridine phosphorylase n=1 Tax=Polychaeton citri CBS 116435 TaxID=1314669 RepID=A0A9P4PXY5_9PEZI|nr:purine and uridine phosphorylase [Polychaeton citri CBS 116435]
MAPSRTITDYQIGIICALPRERTAMEHMLDGDPHPDIVVPSGDQNIYTFGNIGHHDIVVASLGAGTYGTVSAAGVANDLRRSFPHLKYGLMVGIAGAMPRPDSEDGDVRLGDVVVGCVNGVPSVINYALGKSTVDGFDIRSELAEPPEALSRAISALETRHQRLGPTYLSHLSKFLKDNPRLNHPRLRRDYYNMPDDPDHLFQSDFVHPKGESNCQTCVSFAISREPRLLRALPDGLEGEKFVRVGDDGLADYPAVFLGTIGSADTLMKDATERDAVFDIVKEQRKAKLLCFEMEASGIVKNWPCLVIRGICDYSDSHKNDNWQNFAAATAAAYAKDLLLRIPSQAVETAQPVAAVLERAKPHDIKVAQSGSGATFAKLESGHQYNYQQGGTNNKQFNGGTMHF